MRRLALAVAALLSPLALVAQTPATQTAHAPAADPGLAYREAMRPVAWLVGEWEGSGWFVSPAGRGTFTQKEVVRLAANGTVLVIDGLGTGVTPEATRGQPVHQAFAMVTWDAAARTFRMTAQRYGGDAVVDTPEVSDGRYVWRMTVPTGRIRFTIVRTPAGEWHETGEFSPDGTQWHLFMDFVLKRTN